MGCTKTNFKRAKIMFGDEQYTYVSQNIFKTCTWMKCISAVLSLNWCKISVLQMIVLWSIFCIRISLLSNSVVHGNWSQLTIKYDWMSNSRWQSRYDTQYNKDTILTTMPTTILIASVTGLSCLTITLAVRTSIHVHH